MVEERQAQLRGGTREPMTRSDILKKARANLDFAGRSAAGADALAQFAGSLFTSEQVFDASPLRTLGG